MRAPRVTRHTSICHTCINMLTRVWQELEYCIDVYCVTHGAHIEHIQLSKKKLSVFLWL